MEQGPTCSTCHVQCRGETLLLAGSRLVIKYSASLSNTKSLYTLCAPPLVTAGETSACWGRKSELAGRAGKKKRQERVGQRTQKKQSNESKRKLMQLLVPAPRVSPHHQGPTGCRAAHSLSPAAKQVVLQASPSAPGRHPGWRSARAHHLPWAASHWNLLLEGSRQARAQELLRSSEPIGF